MSPPGNRTLAVVQHTAAEYLGLIEDHWEGRSIRFRYYRPFAPSGRLPGAREWAEGLVLLGGGPWGGAPGPSRLPTFDVEVALTATALAEERPILGIGLGALILCQAAGGQIVPTPFAFDVGTARRVAPDALEGFLPMQYPLVRYGRDAPLLPAGAEVLAVDEQGAPAAFRCGRRAFGFSGHPGIKSGILEDLMMEFAEVPPGAESGLEALRGMHTAIEDALVPTMTGLVSSLGLMR